MSNQQVSMNQVHGSKVVVVTKDDIGKQIPKCDGMMTSDLNLELVVKTADCLPIYISDSDNKIQGVVHAGWRGLQREIIRNAVNLLESEFKVRPFNLKIKIGPHICINHYEVKDDVVQFFGKNEIEVKGNKKYLNLQKVAANQLTKLGVKLENIETDKRCTFEDLSLPSYRRDGGTI